MQDKEEIVEILEELLDDYSIPRNVKSILSSAKKITDRDNVDSVKLSEVVYQLQDICDDINLPVSVKPDLWMLLSKLESLKEDIKK